ncbi:hypothetical protein [Jiangella asiatica]|uniref:Uncharacterized protein n=1 Tax=Jiangella asiatica TaxID=2530372 RepID=A0A4R5CSU5_9ACTN|nr:hypothetical protein [Jiangella asiatica]TDE01484.1 hypothetical protein E1269_23175 [Jiangella asiatica]
MPTPASNHTIGPEPGLLGIYLNDHLAGAAATAQLGRRLARRLEGAAAGEQLSDLADDLARDRTALTQFMGELGVPVRRYKLYTAAAAELAGRLKFNGHLLTRSPLSTIVELEMLRLGIEGQANGWRTLRTIGAEHGRPDPSRVDELIDRAVRQASLVEALRVRAVERVFGIETAA